MKDRVKLALKLLALLFVTTPLLFVSGEATAQGNEPLSSMVAVTFVDDNGTGAENAADYVKALVDQYRNGSLPTNIQFPLANAGTDSVRALKGFNTNVVISWLDPLTWDSSAEGPRYGANNDYIAYFGEGWEEAGAPQFNGSPNEGWVWVNHEYISNDPPTATTAPTGQHAVFAQHLSDMGILTNEVTSDTWSEDDLATYTEWFKKQIGGSWFRIVKDQSNNEWTIDRSAANVRYDATSNTLANVVGLELDGLSSGDAGNPLPKGVVPGIMGDCSGGQTPWGTIFTAEENVQDYYGDAEACWSSKNAFVPEAGCNAGSPIELQTEASEDSLFGASPDPNDYQNRLYYGYLTEMDPGVDPSDYYQSVDAGGDGVGHRKMGAYGRIRWENATIVTDENWQLTAGQPIVLYGANDRRGGRIYKFVSSQPYEEGMSKEETRALLDQGTVYVAHFADLDNDTGYTVDGEVPTESTSGQGRWLEMSLESEDVAPNAAALGEGDETVGEVLQDMEWNDIGGFESTNHVLQALFTAANKIGVMELNRPEDVEWNANDPSGTPRIYVAFTKHGRPNVLNDEGVIYDPAVHAEESPVREDATGSIFAMQEANPANPAESNEFTFWASWVGTEGTGPFDVANPDNLMLDADGGVWFGTDGNFGLNGTADALYYLDLNPANQSGANPTYGLPFRVIAGPSDSEATGPAFNANMDTIFFNVQHPGETIELFVYSEWPHAR